MFAVVLSNTAGFSQALSSLHLSQETLTTILSRIVVDLPPTLWWYPSVVLLILGLTACVDAFWARVPDAPIFLGLGFVVFTLWYYAGWPLTLLHVGYGFATAVAIWGVNYLYFRVRGSDAIGMGDAKWSALAVTAFGVRPVVAAWVVGAWLGLIWLAIAGLVWALSRLFLGRKTKDRPFRVHMSPFLFVGLLLGLYWFFEGGQGAFG